MGMERHVLHLLGSPNFLERLDDEGLDSPKRSWRPDSRAISLYDGEWKPCLNGMNTNLKKSPAIMKELEDATGIAPDRLLWSKQSRGAGKTTFSIDTDYDSRRSAYSLIGLFDSDLMPKYGEA